MEILETFNRYESEVRSYCRKFDGLFVRAVGSTIFDAAGSEYLDFWSSAGTVNYGHNPPILKKSVLSYIESDGLCAALDLNTEAKRDFIEEFQASILAPRGLQYRMQFTGPTGTGVIESAVKLARKYTGRRSVAAFTNAYHGMSSTSLGLTGDRHHRQPWPDPHVIRLPFDGYLGDAVNSLDYFGKILSDKSSGIDLPAAVIVETIQCEGGVNVASDKWLSALREITKKHQIPLIVDDIQTGCGRTGSFFSFERSGIEPDLVCLSKSLSGYGLPLSVLLISPSMDVWKPGEDSDTFRGNSLAFVTAAEAIRSYWRDGHLAARAERLGHEVQSALSELFIRHSHSIRSVRGRGMLWGIEFNKPEKAIMIAESCFRNKLIVETCGAEDQVIKIMPPLTIEEKQLRKGLEILMAAADTACGTEGGCAGHSKPNGLVL